jgi:hypothetical protein
MGTRSNIKVEPCNVAWKGTDLGYLDGDIELALEEQAVDITAHQEGTNVIDAIRTGKKLEVTLNLKETSLTQLQAALAAGGAVATAQAEITSITCVADVSSSLQNKYFTINTSGDAVRNYVWINVGGSGVDPAPAGLTGIAVAISANATASTVATAVASAIDALAGYVATASGAVVTVTNASTGGATDAADVNSGFTIEVTQQGCGAITGWGGSKDFTSKFTEAGKLVLHPKVLSSSDKTRDWNAWKAYPNLESIAFSGENPTVVSVTFQVFPDPTRPAQVSHFGLGDGT